MGSPYLLFQREITSAKILSATSESGNRVFQPTPQGYNTGSLFLRASGTPGSIVNGKISVVTAGDLDAAQYKYSADGGSNYKGRLADTTWDDGAEGGAGTSVEVLADTGVLYPSRPVLIDYDLDGVDDRAIIAMTRTSTTPDQIDIYYTTDLTGATGWALMASDVTGGLNTTMVAPALVRRGSDLFLFYHDTTDDKLYVRRSVDMGGTWGEQVEVVAISASATGVKIDAMVLNSGALVVVYTDYASSKQAIRACTSDDGTTWSAAISVTTDTGNDYSDPTIIQEADDKVVVFCVKATVGIVALQSTVTTLATWATYSETIWGADANDTAPCAAIAPDGTIYVVLVDSADKIEYSKFKDGDANYSAVADVADVAAALNWPTLANIGGALWCPRTDTTNNDVDIALTKYWIAFSANGSWFSINDTEGQIMPESWFLESAGSDGRVGDEFTVASEYIYAKERIVQFRPMRPYRSAADGVEVRIVIDMGANNVLPADTVLIGGNFETCNMQMNASDSWATPSVETAVSLVQKTLSSATWGADGTIYKSGAAMAPRKYRGCTVKAGTTGAVFTITDNDAERLYISGSDVSAYDTENAQILSDRAWATQTAARYRFLAIEIPEQNTVAGYYEVWIALFGMRLALNAFHTANRPTVTQAGQSWSLSSGAMARMAQGQARVNHHLVLNRPSAAVYSELKAQLAYCDNGFVPFILIPDSDNAFDFRLVYGPQDVEWDATQTVLTLEEAV